jgi:hypothetical protein
MWHNSKCRENCGKKRGPFAPIIQFLEKCIYSPVLQTKNGQGHSLLEYDAV